MFLNESFIASFLHLPSRRRLQGYDDSTYKVQTLDFHARSTVKRLKNPKNLHLPLVSKSDFPVSVIEEPLQLWTLVEQRHDISLCMQAISDGKQAGAGVSDADTRIAVIIV